MQVVKLVQTNSNARRLWVGQILSQAGTRMYQLGLVWWLVQSAGSSAGSTVGVALVLTALPSIFLVSWIGRLVDRNNTRRLLMRMDLWMAGVMILVAGLVQAELFALHWAYPLILVQALFQAIYDPSLSKIVPQVAEGESMDALVGLMGSTQPAAYFIGATVGALIVEASGLKGLALVSMAGYLWAFNCNRRLVLSGDSSPKLQKEMPQNSVSAKSSPALDSTRSVWQTLPLPLKQSLVAFGLVNFFVTPILVVLPVVVERDLRGNASMLAGLEAMIWLGLLIGTLVLGARSKLRSDVQMLRLGGSLLFTMGAFLALSLLGKALPSQEIGIWGLALFGLGTFLGVNNVRFLSWFQRTVADGVKGRFFAMMQALVGGLTPIGYAFFGWLMDNGGSRTTIIVQVAGLWIVALALLTSTLLAHRKSATGPASLEVPT